MSLNEAGNNICKLKKLDYDGLLTLCISLGGYYCSGGIYLFIYSIQQKLAAHQLRATCLYSVTVTFTVTG
jgi:hypothetical protein